MKSYVITIMDNEDSRMVAERCIRYSSWYNVNIKNWPATTPKDDLDKLYADEGLSMDGLNEVYSRTANCAAAFFSHYSLWKKCVEDNETFAIFEHDAVLNNKVPEVHFDYVMNIGHPSYGKWNTPSTLGVNKLTSKRYFPGAHAYMVTPKGAKKLIEQAKICAKPTDVFMNLDDMPWLQEYYPWPAMAKDEFTTIQKQSGTTAKHNKVKIINAV